MLKIGEFSRLSQVTVKTLHHYDEIGLLKPAAVNQFTSHRYYTLEQLPRIHRIMVLKELGLSLEQIALLIDSELLTEQLRGMLTFKEAQVEQRITEEMARLARIRFHLRQIDMEEDMLQHEIRIKQVEPIRALSIRFIAKNHLHLARVCAEVRAAAREQGIRAIGHPIQINYADEYSQDNVDTEFVLPMDDSWMDSLPLPTFGMMTIREIPGSEAASYLHTGYPDSVNDGLVDLQRWIAAHGYKLSGSIRLVYLRGLIVPLPVQEWMFEIQHPLEKA